MGTAGPGRIDVTGHSSDLGRWRAAQRPADPRLRDYVHGYVASEGFLPRPLHERHMPSLEVAMVLNFAAPHRTIDPADATRTIEHRSAWVVALQHRHQLREAFGDRDFMVVRLTPIGAQMLLQTPMDLLTDRILALEEIDRPFARLLTAHAEAAHDWSTRFDIVEHTIAERLAAAVHPPSALFHSWRMLQASPKDLDLARLHANFGCSRRHLIAQCHTYFGMPPKTIARIRRFNLALDVINRIGRRGPVSYPEGKPYLDVRAAGAVRTVATTAIAWADLALDCGYYDQSHLINEFKSFSGLTPLEFLRRTRQA
jgi:AraC-like DNA-binding protein